MCEQILLDKLDPFGLVEICHLFVLDVLSRGEALPFLFFLFYWNGLLFDFLLFLAFLFWDGDILLRLRLRLNFFVLAFVDDLLLLAAFLFWDGLDWIVFTFFRNRLVFRFFISLRLLRSVTTAASAAHFSSVEIIMVVILTLVGIAPVVLAVIAISVCCAFVGVFAIVHV